MPFGSVARRRSCSKSDAGQLGSQQVTRLLDRLAGSRSLQRRQERTQRPARLRRETGQAGTQEPW